jgi:hypothetical protein
MVGSKRRPPEIKTNKKYLYHLILFAASILIIVAISPRGGKFRYEFQKGKPWLSSALIAPWDFPVLKSEEVITKERDSILRNFSPYFKYDSDIETIEILELDKYLNQLLQEFESGSRKLDPMGFISAKRELNSILSDIYQKGVLEANEITSSPEKLYSEVTVVKGKVAKAV